MLKPASRGRRRLDGFNRLLEDVYGRLVRLSELLAKQGVSREQIARWRRDGLWLVHLLKRLEGKLMMVVSSALPERDPRVLSLWYGLDGRGARVTGAIGIELGISTVEVQLAHDLMLRYLRRDEGRAALEAAVLRAAQETD